MKFEARDIDKSRLPTNLDVIEYLLYIKKTGTPDVKKNKMLKLYLQAGIKVITELWKTTKIPIVANTTLRKYMLNLVNKRDEIIKKTHNILKGNGIRYFELLNVSAELN